MGCDFARPKPKMSSNEGALQRERIAEVEANQSINSFVESPRNGSVSKPLELSDDEHKKLNSKAEDQTRSPPYTKSKPQEITIDTELNDVGLAQIGDQVESPGARDPQKEFSDHLSITVHDSRSNVVFDSRFQDISEGAQTLPYSVVLPVISHQRATSCTILENIKNDNSVEEELKKAQVRLTKSESLISEKDKRIKELLEENRKLQSRRKSKNHGPPTSVPVLANKTSSRFKDTIRDIKKATNFDRPEGWKSKSQSNIGEQLFKATKPSTPGETKHSKTPDAEIGSSEIKLDRLSESILTFGESDKLPNVPLKFGLTVEESKRRRQSRVEAGYKSNNEGGSAWEYSEIMMIK